MNDDQEFEEWWKEYVASMYDEEDSIPIGWKIAAKAGWYSALRPRKTKLVTSLPISEEVAEDIRSGYVNEEG